MSGKTMFRQARRSAMTIAAAIAATALAAPAAQAATVHSAPVPTYQTNGRVERS
jgi:hypothetical protein